MLCLLLSACMILSIVSCAVADQPNTTEQDETPPTIEQPEDTVEDEVVGKILLFTSTEEDWVEYSSDYAYARIVADRYSERVTHINVPLEYVLGELETDQWLENSLEAIEAEIRNEEIKAVFFAERNVNARSMLADRVSELRPDILIVELFPTIFLEKEYDKHFALSYNTDILTRKSLEKGKEMGVETVVFYIWRVDLGEELYNQWFLELMREEVKKYDFEYIEKDSYSTMGVSIHLKDAIDFYGRNTMFFSNQIDLSIQLGSLWSGAVTIPLRPPDLPLVFSTLSDVEYGDYESLQESVREFLDEHGLTGNLAVWLISFNHIAMMAAVEYAIGFIKGEIETGSDIDALNECFRKGFELLGYPEIGFELHRSETYDNLFFLVQDYMVF